MPSSICLDVERTDPPHCAKALRKYQTSPETELEFVMKTKEDSPPESGPLEDTVLSTLREWDPVWAEQCLKVAADPWTCGILPRKTVELIGLAVSTACTHL